MRRKWNGGCGGNGARSMSDSWRVDETYIKVKGKWTYLYRAVDKHGNTIDFYLSLDPQCQSGKTASSAKPFAPVKIGKEPNENQHGQSRVLQSSYSRIEKRRQMPARIVKHRQIKYLNNVSRGRSRQAETALIRPVRGFKTMKTAYATIKGFEVMRALRKGQAKAFNLTRDPIGEKRMIERAFGVGPCAMSEVVTLIEQQLAA